MKIHIFPNDFKSENEIDSNFNIKNIKFSNHGYSNIFDNKTVHYIDLYYKKECIIIQLPKYRINKIYTDINKNYIELIVDKVFIDYFIKPLEEYIINQVHLNSERWFNGKKFTMYKIINSIVSAIKNDYILNVMYHNNTTYYNKYKNKTNLEEILSIIKSGDVIEMVPIIKLTNLQFIDNKFTYSCTLEQAKIYTVDKIIDYSIITNSSQSDFSENEYYHESINSINKNFF